MGSISLSIPQSNLPNSTEDPKVANNFTLLQTLLNGNLDASNISGGFVTPSVLAYRAMPANATAASGDWVVAAPDVTVTLPAPATSLSLAVTANSSVTPAHPVIVSGTNVYGLGLTAASTFSLGSPLASVILESDGTNWLLLGGVQDSGWVTVSSFGANVSADAITPQVRKRGDMLWLRGNVVVSAGGIGAGATLATLPAGYRPASTVSLPLGYKTASAGGGTYAEVAATGVVSCPVGGFGATTLTLNGQVPLA